MEIETILGKFEVTQDGDKYRLNVPPESSIAKTLEKFEPNMWVTLLTKCKNDKMGAEDIMSATNPEGNLVVFFANSMESLTKLINNIDWASKPENSLSGFTPKEIEPTKEEMESEQEYNKLEQESQEDVSEQKLNQPP